MCMLSKGNSLGQIKKLARWKVIQNFQSSGLEQARLRCSLCHPELFSSLPAPVHFSWLWTTEQGSAYCSGYEFIIWGAVLNGNWPPSILPYLSPSRCLTDWGDWEAVKGGAVSTALCGPLRLLAGPGYWVPFSEHLHLINRSFKKYVCSFPGDSLLKTWREVEAWRIHPILR